MLPVLSLHTGGEAELAAAIVLFASIVVTVAWTWFVFR